MRGRGPGQFMNISGLAQDHVGNLVIADQHRIQIVQHDGTPITEFDEAMASCVCVDLEGKLLVGGYRRPLGVYVFA